MERRAAGDGHAGSGRTGRLAGARAEPALFTLASAALLAAIAWRAANPASGANLGAVLAAIAAQLPVTLPAAVLVSAAMALDVAAGAGLLRLARRAPFASWADAALAGVAGAVVLDVALMSVIGGLGWFRAAPLVALLALAALAGAMQRPFCAQALRPGRVRPAPAVLVLVAWSGAAILALASPVVPAVDVLPNHVAPAEHLRVFGSIASLATYPSPMYGPSRLFLGYEALMGTLATVSGQPAALAVAASTPWLLLVTAVAARRLAGAAFGRGAVSWALVAMLASFTFVRLADVRDSVVALPIAALALAALVGSRAGRRRAQPGRGGPDWVLVAALVAATLVHPLVGTLTGATVALATLADPRRHLARTLPALAATAVALLPELAVMTGQAPPPIAGLVALAAGALVAVIVAAALGRPGLVRLAARQDPRRWALVAVIAGALLAGAALAVRPSTAGQVAASVNPAFPLPFAAGGAALAGLVATGRGGRRLVASGVVAGLALLLAAALAPTDSVVGQSLGYEIPKAVGYWLPWVCVPALAGGLAASVRRARRAASSAGGGGLVAAWLAVPAVALALVLVPLGPVAPDSAQASHPTADVTVWDLRTAASGYWQGYPDPRAMVDARGAAVDAFLAGEVAAGRLRATDRLLHVAASYLAPATIPLAALTGIDETVASADAAQTIFTAGGRVHPLADLPPLLRDGFAWVLLEPAGLPPSTRDAILAAGYRSVFAVPGAELFAAPKPGAG